MDWPDSFMDKIICGDCRDVLALMPDCCVDLVVTSPPYPGVTEFWGDLYRPENFSKAHAFLSSVWDECLRVLRPGCKFAINIANTKRRPYLPNTSMVYNWAVGKCEPLGEIIWAKSCGQTGTAWGSYCNPSDPSLADQHEYILIFRKHGTRRKHKGYYLTQHDFMLWRNSIWTLAPAKASVIGHCAPYPLETPSRLIQLYTYPEEIVLDPFIGSGTTAIACVKTNRQYIGIEIDSEYCQIAQERIDSELAQPDLFQTNLVNVPPKHAGYRQEKLIK